MKPDRKSLVCASALSTMALITMTSPAKAQDSWLQLSLGADYSKGKYGDTRDTEIWSTPVQLKYGNGPFTFRISTSFVHLKGPGSLLATPEGRGDGNSASDRSGSGSSSSESNSGSGSSNSGSGSSGSGSSGSSGSGSSGSGSSGGSSGGSDSSGGSSTTTLASVGDVIPGGTSRSVSGVGDVYASMTWSLEPARDLFLDLTGKVKIPAASKSKGLGTGKADVTFAADVTKVAGPLSLYGGGRYRITGKSATFPTRNTWGASVGASIDASRALNLALDYDWQQSSFRGGKASSEITASATMRLSPTVRLQAYGGTGLNAASVDAMFGVQLIWRFARF